MSLEFELVPEEGLPDVKSVRRMWYDSIVEAFDRSEHHLAKIKHGYDLAVTTLASGMRHSIKEQEFKHINVSVRGDDVFLWKKGDS